LIRPKPASFFILFIYYLFYFLLLTDWEDSNSIRFGSVHGFFFKMGRVPDPTHPPSSLVKKKTLYFFHTAPHTSSSRLPASSKSSFFFFYFYFYFFHTDPHPTQRSLTLASRGSPLLSLSPADTAPLSLSHRRADPSLPAPGFSPLSLSLSLSFSGTNTLSLSLSILLGSHRLSTTFVKLP
jgi:hypothetical protein